MRHIPLSKGDHALLYTAQLASFENGEPYLAGTRLLTSEHSWWLADGIVVRDESGEEEPLLRKLQAQQNGSGHVSILRFPLQALSGPCANCRYSCCSYCGNCHNPHCSAYEPTCSDTE